MIPGPDGPAVKRGVRNTWKLRSGLLLAGCGATYLHIYTPTGVATGPAIVSGTIIFFLVNLASVATRFPLGHREAPGIQGDLRFEILLGLVAPAAVFVAFALGHGSDVALGVIAIFLFFFHGPYAELQIRLAEKVRAAGMRTLGDRVRLWRAPTGSEIERRVADVHDFRSQGLGRVWLAALLTYPCERGLTLMRVALCWLVLSGFWVAGDALASQFVDHHLAPQTKVKKSHQEADKPSASAASGGPGAARGSGNEEGGSGGGEEGRADKVACASEIPAGAPRWARHDLRALYLGGLGEEATEPPGFRFGGCPGRAIVPARFGGSFVYAVGRGPGGETKSLVVDSQRFGPEIFLAPAAQKVLELIGSGVMPVGGHPRLFPAGGDVVTVTTPSGSRVLVRAAEHPPGEKRVATPYVELPPTVATAWLGAMGEAERWLWPQAPRAVPGGELYGLAERPGGPARYDVLYDPRTGGSTRDGYVYTRPETPLGYLELKAWAESGTGG